MTSSRQNWRHLVSFQDQGQSVEIYGIKELVESYLWFFFICLAAGIVEDEVRVCPHLCLVKAGAVGQDSFTFWFVRDADKRLHHWDSHICIIPPKLETSDFFSFCLFYFLIEEALTDNRKYSVRPSDLQTRILTLYLAFSSLWSELLLDLKALKLSVPPKDSFSLYASFPLPHGIPARSVSGVLSLVFSLFCHRSEHNCCSSSRWKCLWTSANCSVHLLSFCQCALSYCTSLLIFLISFCLGSWQVYRTLITGWLTLTYDQRVLFKVSEAGCPLLHMWDQPERLSVHLLCKALIPWADLADSRRATAYFLHPHLSSTFSFKNSVAYQFYHHFWLAKMEEN